MHTEELIRKSIIEDMSEGVMTIGFNGIISHVNPAAEDILGMKADALVGKSFARCFFELPENDAFNQCILDAIYDASCAHRNIRKSDECASAYSAIQALMEPSPHADFAQRF